MRLIGYDWRLREVMAAAGMFSTTKLVPLLEERGVYLSTSQVYRLAAEKPERMNMHALVALLDIFDCTFEDLGNAIRKCRIDLGVDIEIDVGALKPIGDKRLGLHYCALGLVRYDRNLPTGGVGYLLYIKAGMCGDEPQDVVQYRSEHPEFPHQPTADQFFDEPQFESYRRLGLHIGDTLFGSACARARANDQRASSRSGNASGIDLEQQKP